jgi:Ca2+-binding RTX toxin-like protein
LNNEYPYYTCDGGGDGNDKLLDGSGDDLIAGESGYDVIEGLEYSLEGQIKIT